MFDHLPKFIVFARHPQSEHNVDSDAALRRGVHNRHSPLTEFGALQRDIAAEHIRSMFPDISTVLCSTLRRTHEIPRAAGFTTIKITPELDERNMGVWHRLPREDVLATWPDEEDRNRNAGYYEYTPTEGESCRDVDERLLRLLASDRLGEPDSTTFISGHGTTGLCLRRLLTGASVEEWMEWYRTDRFKNASITVYWRCGDFYKTTQCNYAPWEALLADNDG